MRTEEIYNLKLTPEEHYFLIDALGSIMDVCNSFAYSVYDPMIDKIRDELLVSWKARFEESDRK